MTELSLTKHHGLGNDFLVALGPTSPDVWPDGRAAALALSMCDRQTGVGADGLIFATPLNDTTQPQSWEFRLFNSDGSAAEVSGNGLRCFGQAIAMAQGVDRLAIAAHTLAGERLVDVRLDDRVKGVASVEMGEVRPGVDVPADFLQQVAEAGGVLPADANARWFTGDVGNPHIVFVVADPEAVDLPSFGTAVEKVLGGINVHVIAVSGPDTITMRVWERGAGITQACGSGASVVAFAARSQGLVGDRVEVHMPGGAATVTLEGNAVVLTGSTTYVGKVTVPCG